MPASLVQAFYLASSWLWCIGAFFPILLLRDYGWPSLLVFVLANIGGAAAFGWVMTARRQSAFLVKHEWMLKAFSQVTLAFQLFFVAWLSVYLGWWLLLILLLGVLLFLTVQRHLALIAVAVFFASLVFFGRYWLTEPSPPVLDSEPGWWHSLLPLVIGFALSPYLDLTFHRALQASPNPRLSFTLGFGVFFFILLGFVFVYAAEMNALMQGGEVTWSSLWPLVAFILLQLAFTLAVHLQAVTADQPLAQRRHLKFYGLYTLVVGGLLAFFANHQLPWLDLSLAELVYRSFLLFYGLIFPVYLLLGQRPGLFAASLLVAVPAYALGFLLGGDWLIFLSVGVAWILLMLAAQRLYNKNIA